MQVGCAIVCGALSLNDGSGETAHHCHGSRHGLRIGRIMDFRFIAMSIRFEAQTPLKHNGIGQACVGEVQYRKILYQMSLQVILVSMF